MKTTGIFCVALLVICYFASAQKVFDQVRNLLVNLRKSNVRDQQLADIREKAERAWCKREINNAVRLLARRQHDVDSLEKQIEYLVKTRIEARKDRASRIARIKANDALLAKFKKQRCDNNLLFVKQLKEHMQAIEIMKLLRGDIIAYFNKKPAGERGAFIEQFEEYANLLDETHRQVFSQLKTELTSLRHHRLDRSKETEIKTRSVKSINAEGDELTAQKARTAQQIGSGHIDNTRGALKRLATPKWQKIGDFNTGARKKILGMIDGLIAHLRASRKVLTQHEIKAANDFAEWEDSTEKENEYLREKIRELTKEIKDLTNQIHIARAQLVKRKALRDQAKAALEALRKMCKQKYAYFKSETARRTRENGFIDSAMATFDKILSKLSKRVRERANQIATSGKTNYHEIKHVVSSESGVVADVAAENKERANVVF